MTERQNLQKTLQEIIDGNVANSIPQHVLIAGAEGTGKSYMITRLEQELTASGCHVCKFLYPHCNIVAVDYIINKVSSPDGQRCVILVDDFDKMLEVLPHDEQYKLRAFLFKKNAPTLIATSTGLYEGFSDYRAPFYDAFRVLHVPQLAQDDIAEILSEDVFQKVKDLSEFQNTIPKLCGNLNYIRSLAAALCENRGIEDVVKANDRYFRYMFSSLPNVQQRALYGLALSGETATSADVQKKSGLTAANTASALFRLEKQGIIAKIGDKKRNVTYQINDYLLWLWITK
jgi:hypothetical protein